ncbi:MAG: transcription antitermination factor NusB [Thermoanaerobaculia bacterium]
MHRNHKAREAVLKMLYEYEFNKNKEMVLNNKNIFFEIKGKKLQEYAKDLFEGILSNLENLDLIIQKYLKNWQLERIALVEKNILRIAAYELFYEKDVPAAIIIDDAIELSKIYGNESSPKFVNGILDCILHKELGERVVKTK